MRKLVLLLFGIVLNLQVFATTQVPDKLIYKNDTFPISIFPLESYIKQNEIKEFPKGVSTGCWRGYSATWKIEDDSLFLVDINRCPFPLGDEIGPYLKELKEKVSKKRMPATWFSGSITIKTGKYYEDLRTYEKEEEIVFLKGVIKEKIITSNVSRIKTTIFSEKVAASKDTLLYYLNKNLDLKEGRTMDGLDCFDEYILTYNQNGSIRNVQLLSIFNDTLLHIESLTKKNTRCSSKIKESLERLSLNYINPYSDFRIIIKLYYQNTLEIWECFQYQGKLSNDDNWNNEK